MQVLKLKEFALRDRLGPLVVKGEPLADHRYTGDDKPRWTDMALYRITDPGGTPRPDGVLEELLAGSMSNRQRAALAGIMPRLVRLIGDTQPSYKYALEIVAKSYVYHRFDSSCVRPRHHITTVGKVYENNHRWQNLISCAQCKPLDLRHMEDVDRIAEERPDPHVYLCTTASDIITKLYQRNGEISVLAAKMLRTAAVRDPEIAAVLQSTRRV